MALDDVGDVTALKRRVDELEKENKRLHMGMDMREPSRPPPSPEELPQTSSGERRSSGLYNVQTQTKKHAADLEQCKHTLSHVYI